ncbi:MAG: DEAD/DEAH box helicase family protein, partial [Selenomonadaceae bacterium]|nr:DEAD/DEAH box helicase family protein [Selenomonadaceae bacterium]
MQLKNYQQTAINSLEKFIELLVETKSLQTAYKMTCAESDIPSAKYCETLPGVPQVCFKVPTGGGKTFMAAASLKPIHKKFPSKIIVWL